MIALDEKQLSSLSDHKIIWITNALYSSYLQSIVRAVRQTYPSVPLSADNVYWEFMYEVPNLLRKLDASSGSEIIDAKKCKTYLGNRARYFTYTLCHQWMKRAHSVLNEANSYDDELAPKKEQAYSEDYELQDITFDLSVLTHEELLVCDLVIFKEQTVKSVMLATKLSRYKIKAILATAKAKLALQAKAQMA